MVIAHRARQQLALHAVAAMAEPIVRTHIHPTHRPITHQQATVRHGAALVDPVAVERLAGHAQAQQLFTRLRKSDHLHQLERM